MALQQSELIMDKFKKTGVEAKLVVKKGAGHGWPGLEKDLIQFADWFDQHLRKESTQSPSAASKLIPQIDGDWWQIAGNPDLGTLTGEKQQPVDFAVWQAEDGTWQLWSCIRQTKCGGKTRLFYHWEGKARTDANWTTKGIAMKADPLRGRDQRWVAGSACDPAQRDFPDVLRRLAAHRPCDQPRRQDLQSPTEPGRDSRFIRRGTGQQHSRPHGYAHRRRALLLLHGESG